MPAGRGPEQPAGSRVTTRPPAARQNWRLRPCAVMERFVGRALRLMTPSTRAWARASEFPAPVRRPGARRTCPRQADRVVVHDRAGPYATTSNIYCYHFDMLPPTYMNSTVWSAHRVRKKFWKAVPRSTSTLRSKFILLLYCL